MSHWGGQNPPRFFDPIEKGFAVLKFSTGGFIVLLAQWEDDYAALVFLLLKNYPKVIFSAHRDSGSIQTFYTTNTA
jgi:hypothetical protein